MPGRAALSGGDGLCAPLPTTSPHLRDLYARAALAASHGRYGEAAGLFQSALRDQVACHGPIHAEVGVTLHNLGIAHLMAGELDLAAQVGRHAVRVREDAVDLAGGGGRRRSGGGGAGGAGGDRRGREGRLAVASSLAQLGIAQMEGGRPGAALASFRRALAVRRAELEPRLGLGLGGSGGTTGRWDGSDPAIEGILANIGGCLFAEGNMRGSLKELEACLALRRGAVEARREGAWDGAWIDDGLVLDLAAALTWVGSARLRLGFEEDAIGALEEALYLRQSVLGDDHPAVLATVGAMDFIDEHRLDGLADVFRGGSLPPLLRALGSAPETETEADAGGGSSSSRRSADGRV